MGALCCKSIAKTEAAKPFKALYEVGAELGKGHFAVVKLCTHRQSGDFYAVKVISKKKLSNPTLMREEVAILRKVIFHASTTYQLISSGWESSLLRSTSRGARRWNKLLLGNGIVHRRRSIFKNRWVRQLFGEGCCKNSLSACDSPSAYSQHGHYS